MTRLSERQLSFFNREGYLLIEDCLPLATIKRIIKVIEKLKKDSLNLTKSNHLFDVAPGHSKKTPKLRRIKEPDKQHIIFEKLVRSKVLMDIVAPLLGGTVRFDHSKLNFKPPDGKAKIEWHQDWAFYPHTNDNLLAVGIMIEDCNIENGPLMVLPKSHKGPIYNHHKEGVFCGAVETNCIKNVSDAIALTAPAGSISIHHVRTLHASAENYSASDRPLLLFSYSAVDAFPVFSSFALEEYDRKIIRGKPTVIPRSDNIPMRLPLPRKVGASSIFDDQSNFSKM